MAADATTFFWAFTAVFGLLAYYLWLLDRKAHRLQRRVAALEAATRQGPDTGSSTTTAKNQDDHP